MAMVASNQHIGSGLDAQGGQMHQNARAGLEWGLAGAWGGSCIETESFALPNGGYVTVNCVELAPSTESGVGSIYRLVSTACTQPGTTHQCPGSHPAALGYVERRVMALLEGPLPP